MVSTRQTQIKKRSSKARVRIAQEPISQLQAVVNSDLWARALGEWGVEYRERIFSPLWTLWIFLSQVFNSDQSLKKALSDFVAVQHQLGNQQFISMSTGAYSKARKRLETGFLRFLTLASASELEKAQPSRWLWHQRVVKIVDGTTVSMPDTESNQLAFGSPGKTTKFPLSRIVALISLATGAVEDLVIGANSGKGSGEASLIEKLWENFRTKDVLLFDRLLATYSIMSRLILADVDFVSRPHGSAKINLKEAKKIGKNDWLINLKSEVNYKKPPEDRLDLPAQVEVRVVKVDLKVHGFRAKTIYLITSLLDTKEYPAKEIAALYRQRWEMELDLRCIKSVMQMDILRGRTADMVQKEIWVHVLGYNLIRIIMAQAAELNDIKPRDLSFKGALQVFESFRPFLSTMNDHLWAEGYQSLLKLVGIQKLVKRPNRIEPRAVKRPPGSHYTILNVPRDEARKMFWKKGSAYQKRKKDQP